MIRAVHSGDSVSIAQGNNVERFFFANVIAPHMGSPQRAEDAFAHAARELIRDKIIGRKCQYTIDYQHNGRNFVTLMVEGECVNLMVVSAGFAKVKIRG